MVNPRNLWYIGMTEAAIRQRVVDAAVSFLGIKEGTAEHKELVNIYNSQDKLPRGYQLQEEDPWCAATISVIGIMLGISDTILPEVGCGPMIELYKARGRWEERDDYVPKPGDIWMADWDAKKGECLGEPNHVELVEWCDGKNIGLIGGNSDDRVKRRTICVEYVKTRGFCLPDYAALVQPFKDVPGDHIHADGIAWGAEKGIVLGVGDGLFEPDRPVTRGELMTILHRLSK